MADEEVCEMWALHYERVLPLMRSGDWYSPSRKVLAR